MDLVKFRECTRLVLVRETLTSTLGVIWLRIQFGTGSRIFSHSLLVRSIYMTFARWCLCRGL